MYVRIYMCVYVCAVAYFIYIIVKNMFILLCSAKGLSKSLYIFTHSSSMARIFSEYWVHETSMNQQSSKLKKA